jgi:hypothetical protein
MVDAQDDMVVEAAQTDRDQVAIIEPDQLDNESETLENIPLATDCACCPDYTYASICCRVRLTSSCS